MRISDWSSDVCSSDLDVGVLDELQPPALGTEVELADAQRVGLQLQLGCGEQVLHLVGQQAEAVDHLHLQLAQFVDVACGADALVQGQARVHVGQVVVGDQRRNVHQHLGARSEEHTSELQSLMRISYAVFCLKKKKNIHIY